MTTMGLEYLKHSENVRANLERERLNQATLDETIRSNKARESYNLSALEETTRHNKATESISLSSLQETIRHNKASENLTQSNIALGYEQLAVSKDRLAYDIGATNTKNQLSLMQLGLTNMSEWERNTYASELYTNTNSAGSTFFDGHEAAAAITKIGSQLIDLINPFN